MSVHPKPLVVSQGQPCCLVLIRSYNNKLEAVYLPIPDNQTPEAFMTALGQTYKTHVSKSNRLFYRCALSKKTAVSIAEASPISTSVPPTPRINTTYQLTSLTPAAAAIGECPVSVMDSARDTILTDALRNPSVLGGADRADFWEQYERVVVDAEHNEHPKAAILIHLEDDPIVAKAFHVLGSVISLTAALVAHFAL